MRLNGMSGYSSLLGLHARAVDRILQHPARVCMHMQETAEAAARPAEEAEATVKSSGGSDSSLSHTAASAGVDSAAEVARFGAAKERKHSMEAGIALFNRSAILTAVDTSQGVDML